MFINTITHGFINTDYVARFYCSYGLSFDSLSYIKERELSPGKNYNVLYADLVAPRFSATAVVAIIEENHVRDAWAMIDEMALKLIKHLNDVKNNKKGEADIFDHDLYLKKVDVSSYPCFEKV